MTKEEIRLLKGISSQCGIKQEDMEVEKNTVYGNKLNIEGRSTSGLRSIKSSQFLNYLEGFKDSCSVIREYNIKHQTKPPL